MTHPYKEIYDAGEAIGHKVIGAADIKSDTMVFRFRDELFEFPTILVLPSIAKWNGYWYAAKIEDLRKLKENRNGDHS